MKIEIEPAPGYNPSFSVTLTNQGKSFTLPLINNSRGCEDKNAFGLAGSMTGPNGVNGLYLQV